MTERPSWDDTWIDLCFALAKRSKDRSTRVGCVIVDPVTKIPKALGYNGIPRNCSDDLEHRHVRPAKYRYFEHGERNAIFNAAREGIPLEGSVCYVPAPPCVDCSRALIQSGIVEVVCASLFVPDRWREDCDAGMEMLTEAGVLVRKPNSLEVVTSWEYQDSSDGYPGWGDNRSRGLSPN